MLNFIKKWWPVNSWFKELPYHVRQGKWGEAQAVRFIRFDVIEVIGEVHWLAQAQITHLENVFTLSPKTRLWW